MNKEIIEEFENTSLKYLTMILSGLGVNEKEAEEIKKQVIDIFLNKLEKALTSQREGLKESLEKVLNRADLSLPEVEELYNEIYSWEKENLELSE